MSTPDRTIDRAGLMRHIARTFGCDPNGLHGPAHWARVRLNGLWLCVQTGGNPLVVELFAMLHDSCRIDEGLDEGHGLRAAEQLHRLNGRVFSLTERELSLLSAACEGHSNRGVMADITIQCCWDADRLDLWRVGVTPDAAYLCTQAAKDVANGALAWPSPRPGHPLRENWSHYDQRLRSTP